MTYTVTFFLERTEDGLCVFSDLFGYYLWARDSERVIATVIPLAQHLIWRNEHVSTVPKGELDLDELLAGKTTIQFEEQELVPVPARLVHGQWWNNPDGKIFFVPIEDGVMPESIMKRIAKDMVEGTV